MYLKENRKIIVFLWKNKQTKKHFIFPYIYHMVVELHFLLLIHTTGEAHGPSGWLHRFSPTYRGLYLLHLLQVLLVWIAQIPDHKYHKKDVLCSFFVMLLALGIIRYYQVLLGIATSLQSPSNITQSTNPKYYNTEYFVNYWASRCQNWPFILFVLVKMYSNG